VGKVNFCVLRICEIKFLVFGNKFFGKNIMADHFNPYMNQFDSRNIFSGGQILGNGVITEMDEYLEEEHDDQRIMDIHKTLRVQIELPFLLLAKKIQF
jgi:hypothetical protein